MLLTLLLTFICSARAIAVAPKTTPAIEVSITQISNTEIKVVLLNAGNEPLNLLKPGSILDDAPIHKLQVEQSSTYMRIVEER